MTTQEAIRELKAIRQYCAAKSIPAINYALKVLEEKERSASADTQGR